MKYILITLILLTSNSILTAQRFEELKQFTPFDNIKAHAILFFDYNNDKADDMLIMGVDKNNKEMTKLYKNHNGSLIEVNDTPFGEYPQGTAAASDIDNDGDYDLFFAGIEGNDLFINSGGKFNRYITQGIYKEKLFNSARKVAISDLNNDGRAEFFITNGIYGSNTNIYKYYRSSDEVGYEEIKNHPIDIGGIIRFSDIDNDGFEDLLISGTHKSGVHKTKLYKNSASTFEQVLDAPFGDVAYESIEFSDIDNDGDEDLIVSEPIESNENGTRLYKNNSGTFEEVLNTPFEDLTEVSLAFSDINYDGYSDLIFNGKDKSGSYITKLYLNESGTFKTVTNIGLDSIGGGSIALSDVDGDGYDDILISGQNKEGKLITKLYKNEQGEFIGQYGTPFFGIEGGSIAFSDIDNDGYEELLITGHNIHLATYISKLYKNVGGIFEEIIDTPFDAVWQGASAFSDIDNDGYKDLFITGRTTESKFISKLYKNEAGILKEVFDTPFEGITSSSIAFSDIDNNGYKDLFISGGSKTGMVAKLYTNEVGIFSDAIETQVEAVSGAIAFSDIDNDGYNDLFVLGFNKSIERIAKLYKNEEGTFIEVLNTPFDGLSGCTATFIDINNDGYEELLITGDNGIGSQGFTAKLYKNKEGVFTELLDTPFDGVSWCSVSISDINKDGNNDIFITGRDNSNDLIAKLYSNLGPTSSVNFNVKEVRYDFEVYPNPTKLDKFEIKFDTEFFGSLIIEIIDINGQTINKMNKTIEFGQQIVSVETGNLSKGFFLVKLTSNGKEEIHKLIIQ